ncbi:hypothetical protein PC39_11817 [Salinisphaera sp. PC39]|uniref:YajG family lipoprotein n=1 Tax=Salinisphaera sp. PC39 TaxID=1304156 RepID=UPI00333F4335
MKQKTHRLVPVLLMQSVFMGGCAFGNINLDMPPQGDLPDNQGAAGQTLRLVMPFEDSRAIKARCGMKKNSYNMDTADVLCSQPPAQWVADRLQRGLEERGYTVETVRETAGGNGTVIEGDLIRLFVEPVIGFATVSIEADIQVRLEVRTGEGFRAERTFYVKGDTRSAAATRGTFDTAFESAADQISTNMVMAIDELVDRYPELGQHGEKQ